MTDAAADHIEKRDETAKVATVAAEGLATFDLKDSHRTTESAVEQPLECSGASGLEAWLCALVAPETSLGFVDFDILDILVGSSVLPDAPSDLDTPELDLCYRLLVETASVEALQCLLHLRSVPALLVAHEDVSSNHLDISHDVFEFG